MTTDIEITFRVGSFRVHYYATEGGMSVEAFVPRHNGHPQGEWFVAHDEDHSIPECAEAIRLAHAYRNTMDLLKATATK